MALIESREQIQRVKTAIEGFDEQLEGGIPSGYVCLMAGMSGTMKSSIAFNVIYNAAKEGKNCLYLSLEQSSQSLLNHLIAMGFDLNAVNVVVLSDVTKVDKCVQAVQQGKGTLIVTDLGAIRKEMGDIKSMSADADWLNAIKNVLKQLKDGKALDCFVLDSLSAMYSLTRMENPRTELFHVFEFFRDLGTTSLLVAETFGDDLKYAEYGVEDYLSDGIFHLAMVRDGRKIRRELRVVKMRATNCNMDVFILDYKSQKFRALTKLPY